MVVQKGSGFIPVGQLAFLCDVYKLSLCFGFLPQPKDMQIRPTGFFKLPKDINVSVYELFITAKHWQPAQGALRLSPQGELGWTPASLCALTDKW